MSDDIVKNIFRFTREHLLRLVCLLRLPDTIYCETGHTITGLTALCIVLRRLSYPNRLNDLILMFGLSPQSLSQIIKTTLNIIVAERAERAVTAKGGAIPTCWGFIDSTAKAICRPTLDQELYYSGHKRYHCLKYQSVICPDGVIVSSKVHTTE
ncbi:hypothetical protein NQ315_004010 [Exocentrus adspersus]|uniref:DDE Tnp4 domain-containing protein n=1 Tax=Exocentrus adspersus TaxID=1586481 RepID=A0AAV8V6Z4_9CUCU|nr:hypothetical protein NQ315_004010 [Exocentrus adspersus]